MAGITPLTAATRRAYSDSRYSADGLVAYVGSIAKETCSGRTRLTLVLLGACNPGGRRRPDGWNARMMDRLRAVLRRFRCVAASGSLGRWSEPMLLAPMDPRQAVVVARRFRQNAIVVIARGGRTRLVILPAGSDGPAG